MSDSKVILVTSCKGGVGKSTISANLAMSLAKLGKKTLLVDLDFSNRSLDLILGCEDSVMLDICDVVKGRATLEKACLTDARCGLLYFCAGPLFYTEKIETDEFVSTVEKAKENFEYIIIDTPGSAGEEIQLAAKVADMALVVASHQPTSQRAAEKTAQVLTELGTKEIRLVINSFDASAVLSGERPGIIDIIDKTKIQVIGVIPYSRALALAQEDGLLSCERKKLDSSCAFDNIAKRICGENVPLMKGFHSGNRRKLILA